MSPVTYETTPHGNRTLPQALDDLATSIPDRLYASVPRDRDLSNGFADVSCGDMARCVNFTAHWISTTLGRSESFETLAYIGIPDLRSAAVFLGAVKCGYRVLLPSPRNPPATNMSLMEQTNCTRVLHAAEVAPVIKPLVALRKDLVCLEIPSFRDMLGSRPEPFPYEKPFADAQDDPIVVLHSSGSTGLPKPITMTHATFAVLDNERYLPKVPGRRNRDYSIWDFNGGGRFYTVFPYFHLAGFLSLLINPIFTESSSPVLGPPLMPPSGALLKEVMRHQKLRALYLPPSIAEQLLMEPGGLEFFKELDFLCYTGGPFSPNAGEQLSKVTELCPLYGSTEAFQVPQLAPSAEDWAWMEWNPHFKVEMQPSEDEADSFELVLFADESTRTISALNHNMRSIAEYHTKDLFKQHPEKPGLWRYYGRKDDIIVLSNGEKFNPVPIELTIQGHPALAGALVIGQGRSRATLLIEPKPDVADEKRNGLSESIWPLVEDANRLVPAQGRILRGNIIVAKLNKPFSRAGKGTIVRKLTEQLYNLEIEELYATTSAAPPQQELPRLQATMKPHFEIGTVLSYVRSIISSSFPELSGIEDDDDLFSSGLDSVMIGQLLGNLKGGLKESSPASDLSWLGTRIVYRNSSIRRLSNVLAHFLNSGELQTEGTTQFRITAMDELVQKYTQGLTKASTPAKEDAGPRSVALVGSTGYLGPQILAALLENPSVASIVCLNRGSDAGDRTAKALESAGFPTNEHFKDVKFLAADLGSANLGLSERDFNLLSSEVDTIVYNSWNPNFSLPLPSFEKPFLSGLRHIIDWSRHSPKRPRITFISSIAAVGNWSKVFPKEPEIPEAPIEDGNVAMHMGYGESKGIAERVLQIAHRECGIPVNIIRIGQIGGTITSSGSTWPAQGWLLGIIRTSKALGVLPTHVSPVDWIPVDALAMQISDTVANADSTSGYHIFNLVHPEVAAWGMFLDTLRSRFGVDGQRISLPQWLDRLDEKAQADATEQKKYAALKYSDFLRSMGEGREDMRCKSENISKISQVSMIPLSEQLLAEWLAGWKF
ncbi:acetyl-CoA synthetase-like protein [Trematosphaeria pertusa]|uniref:Acetyl-CoA synthetase-like protein n=1 Tax=Trematosphaeria pertusa TaxID=390896 RepID=A0A6A6J0I8_9PLEO|nr:acetyl-CoA synthetase-like protein [Trematosphaeria pertusa]KAF2256018.1 acetyl-CoA synthetase-like protein [Trematosphaeria pertusa]